MVASRRQWLIGIGAGFGAFARLIASDQGLPPGFVPAPGCKDGESATPTWPLDRRTFKANAPERTSLGEPGMTGTPLELTGAVSGLTCGRVKGARVDFWQADARGVYDATGFRLRGHQLTDANGVYRLTTIVPGAAPGRAPHVCVRVQVIGKADVFTELFFPDQPSNARDPHFKPNLVMTTTSNGRAQAARFDIVLDI